MSNVSSMMWRSSPRCHWDIFDDDIRLDRYCNISKNHLKRSSIYFFEDFLKIVRHWASYWILRMLKKIEEWILLIFFKKEEGTREITIDQKLQEYVFFTFRSSNSKMIAYSLIVDVKNSLYVSLSDISIKNLR